MAQQDEEGQESIIPIPSLVVLSARVVASSFTKDMVGKVPSEVMDAIQKQMAREKQVEYLGEYKEWHANGRLRKMQYYKDGKEHGVCLKYWPNGELWHKKECDRGELKGQRKLWYKNGQLKWYAYYREGSQVHGQCKWWHSNGQLRSQANYKNDKLHGEYQFYARDGTVVSRGYYLYGYRFDSSTFLGSVMQYPAKVLAQF